MVATNAARNVVAAAAAHFQTQAGEPPAKRKNKRPKNTSRGHRSGRAVVFVQGPPMPQYEYAMQGNYGAVAPMPFVYTMDNTGAMMMGDYPLMYAQGPMYNPADLGYMHPESGYMPMVPPYAMAYGEYHSPRQPKPRPPRYDTPAVSTLYSDIQTVEECDAALIDLEEQRKLHAGVANKRRRQKLNARRAQISLLRVQLQLANGDAVHGVASKLTRSLSAVAEPFVPTAPSEELEKTTATDAICVSSGSSASACIAPAANPAVIDANEAVGPSAAGVEPSGVDTPPVTKSQSRSAGGPPAVVHRATASAEPHCDLRRDGCVSRAGTRRVSLKVRGTCVDKENSTSVSGCRRYGVRPISAGATLSGAKQFNLSGTVSSARGGGRDDLLSPIVNALRTAPR
jgi:hypothetical protein